MPAGTRDNVGVSLNSGATGVGASGAGACPLAAAIWAMVGLASTSVTPRAIQIRVVMAVSLCQQAGAARLPTHKEFIDARKCRTFRLFRKNGMYGHWEASRFSKFFPTSRGEARISNNEQA